MPKTNTYVVEKILEKKRVAGELLYLIKWVGWPKSQATWEPVRNLKNVQWMIDEFEQNSNGSENEHELPNLKKKTVKKSKTQPEENKVIDLTSRK